MSDGCLTLPFKDIKPEIHHTAFCAQTAVIVGDVVIGLESSVWFGTVLRGDVEPIRVGSKTNLQDLVMVHVTGGKGPATIGDQVTVGHRAVIHGCTIHDRCLIGIGAIVLDGAEVGPDSIVAAGAVVPPGMKVPPRTLVRGVPARVSSELDEKALESILQSSLSYRNIIKYYKGSR